MNKIIKILFLFFISSSFSYGQVSSYLIKGEIKGIKDTTCILAYYYGDKQYAKDTASIDSGGKFQFKGYEKLEQGMHFVLLPNGQHFELIIDKDQKFEFKTELGDLLVEKMTFVSSKSNSQFYQYLKDLSLIQKGDKNKINLNMIATRSSFIKKYPDNFFSVVLEATIDVEIPKDLDSLAQYRYYKKHFWDNVNLEDSRILRTPIFHQKWSQYIDNLTFKNPDSIIVSIDEVINKCLNNQETFKYLLSYNTSKYETSKIMGMEKIFVHLVEKYFKTNKVDWIDDDQMRKIIERSDTWQPLVVGEKAPNLILRDEKDRIQELHKINADFILLMFYDPDCGHCKTEIPKIKDVCDKIIKDGQNLEVFAVCTELEKELWMEFIKEKKLDDWINVGEFKTFKDGEYKPDADPYVHPNPWYRNKYDITSTPRIYILDKNKNILANALKGNIPTEKIHELIFKSGTLINQIKIEKPHHNHHDHNHKH